MSIVKVSFILNGELSTIQYDITRPLSIFKKVISLIVQENLNKYDLYYNNVILNEEKEDASLNKIIGNDSKPIFRLILKNTNVIFDKPSKYLRFHVDIEKFPSRTEIFSLIKIFVDEKSIDYYNTENKQNSIRVSFKNDYEANELIKMINQLRSNNALYSKIIVNYEKDLINLNINSANTSREELNNNNNSLSFPNLKRIKLKNVHSNLTKNNFNLQNIPNIINRKTNSEYLTIRTQTDKSIESKNSIKMILKDENLKENFYKNASYVRISSPYMSNHDIEIKEKKESSRKWIIKKDFRRFIANKNNFISNFVNLNPYSPPYKDFRDIKKDHWIVKKDFI